jgi:hypothetical protein
LSNLASALSILFIFIKSKILPLSIFSAFAFSIFIDLGSLLFPYEITSNPLPPTQSFCLKFLSLSLSLSLSFFFFFGRTGV